MSTHIRRFEATDIPFALEQTAREGWDNTAGVFQMLLECDPDGAFVAVLDGAPAGMITTTRYQESAWIGNLIVPPQFRKHSIGTALMRHAIELLEARGVRCMRLEADPLGINIYRRLGFRDEFDSPRFRCDQPVFSAPQGVALMKEGDMASVCEIDRRVFGDDRERLLRLLYRNRIAAYCAARSGVVTGFAILQASGAGYRLGPFIAEEPEAARQLLSAAGYGLPPKPVIIATPEVNADAIALFAASGFRRTPSSLRMVRGIAVACGVPERVYALAGGAIG